MLHVVSIYCLCFESYHLHLLCVGLDMWLSRAEHDGLHLWQMSVTELRTCVEN
jgi:hypothetical protein